jgi:hypothetical protein
MLDLFYLLETGEGEEAKGECINGRRLNPDFFCGGLE